MTIFAWPKTNDVAPRLMHSLAVCFNCEIEMQRNKLQDGQKMHNSNSNFRILSAIQLQLNFASAAATGSGSNRQSFSPFRAHGDNLFMEPPWTLNGLPHKSCGSLGSHCQFAGAL